MQQELQLITNFQTITKQPAVSLYIKYIEHINSGATSGRQTPAESNSSGYSEEALETSVICITVMSLTCFLSEVARLCRALEAAISCNFF